jgi:putative ABC transport system ATP-binding protein
MGIDLLVRNLRIDLPAQLVTSSFEKNKSLENSRLLFSLERLSIASGESLALCGPSGSGKTTLLNVLAGLQRHATAEVVWSDAHHTHDLMQLSGAAADRWRLQHAGLVFQQFEIFTSMSALENVISPYRFDHWRCPQAARARALDLLAQFEIPATAMAGTLSRGEQQRVAIARALIRQPQVVFADEPTASLDPATAKRVMDVLLAACAANTVTLIVATHDSALLQRFSRVLKLQNAQLVDA